MRRYADSSQSIVGYLRASPRDRAAAHQVLTKKQTSGVRYVDDLAIAAVKFQVIVGLVVFWLLWLLGMIIDWQQSWHVVLVLTVSLVTFSVIMLTASRRRIARLRRLLSKEERK
jgi:uncharacterized integral membrane protein